jgi:hypothetical protein
VSVFASDGTFVLSDAVDIYGAVGVTLLDSASYVALGTVDEIFSVVALNISGAKPGDELFLRFNNYKAVSGADPGPVLDNVRIIPEPSTMILVGLSALLLRKRLA